MKQLILAAFAALFALPAWAATYNYTYTGSNYESSAYTFIRGTIQGNHPTFRGSYDPGMSITASFSLSSPLSANLSNLDVKHLTTSASFFDGINHFSIHELDLSIWTDSTGVISDWNMLAHNGGAADVDRVTSSGTAGDAAYYAFEYDIDPAFGCSGCGFESASASTASTGSWSVTVVPLPASLPLLGFGVLGLGWIGRRSRRKG